MTEENNFNFENVWNILWTIAAFILTILGSFIFPPPSYVGEEALYGNLGKFVIAIIVGLILVLIRFWGLKTHIIKWWITAVIFLVLFLSCFFYYQYVKQKWTCICDPDENIVYLIGGVEVSPPKISSNGDKKCETLLQENSCAPENIWVKDSIEKRRLALAGMYILMLSLGVICMMSVAQAVYSSLKNNE